MADKSVRVEIRGLAELQRAFKQLNANVSKELTAAMRTVAKDIAQDAAHKVPHRSGKAAASIKPRSAEKRASVAFGGSSAPYFAWLNFGGSTGRGHVPGRAGSGSIKRSVVKPDRYVYATIEERDEQTREAIGDAITKAARSADFETRG